MANENISYKDAIIFKKNNCYTNAFSYSNVVNSQPPTSEILKPNTSLHEENFPSLHENHHFFNSRKTKFKPRHHQTINNKPPPVELFLP